MAISGNFRHQLKQIKAKIYKNITKQPTNKKTKTRKLEVQNYN